jgi:sugar O-acyltransferase (sialic acid O-acetyltransferase NeuD family)
LTHSAILIGAGGHAKVVHEAMIAGGVPASEVQLRADRAQRFLGHNVACPEYPDGLTTPAHIAIGHNGVRARLGAQVLAQGGRLLSVIHPDAHVSAHADIGAGAFIACRALIAASATLGQGTILNHGAIVDHDCQIGDYTHIAPAAVLGGGVRVGARVLVGANATLLPGLDIGDDVVIGAGSVVTKPIAPHSIWIGAACVSKE